MATDGDGHVFVTVGTTRFDALVDAVCHPEVLAALHTKGYRSMTVQHGRGPPPQCCPAHDNTDADAPSSSGRAAPASRKSSKGTTALHVQAFPFTPSLDAQMKKAQLVVSHAGSGSVFEALKLRKQLVVVVNDALMDNHQAELACELEQRQHCLVANPAQLLETLQAMPPLGEPSVLMPYEEGEPSAVVAAIDAALGVA